MGENSKPPLGAKKWVEKGSSWEKKKMVAERIGVTNLASNNATFAHCV